VPNPAVNPDAPSAGLLSLVGMPASPFCSASRRRAGYLIALDVQTEA
jgi:hypothetical protein